MTSVADPALPEGFPDLFVFTLRDKLQQTMGVDPDFPGAAFFTRPVRPTDPNRSVGVVEGQAEPSQYEIGMNDPAVLEWTVAVQVFAKNTDEVQGRNIRSRLLQRVRHTLFLPGTVQALMTLNDGYDRVSKFRVRRIDFDSATARDANKQFFFLGTIELIFHTEKL